VKTALKEIKMGFYARLITGASIDLFERDYQTLKRMVSRGVENGVVLQNGDVIKSAAIIYLGTEETPTKAKVDGAFKKAK